MIQKIEKCTSAVKLWFEKFSKRWKADFGDAVLTTTVISIPFFIIVGGGLAVDVSKNINMRVAHQSQAQTAAQSSVRSIDASGSLNLDTIRVFHNSLEREYDTDMETAIWQGNCSQIDDEVFPNYKIRLQAENRNGQSHLSPVFTYVAGDNFEQKLQQFASEGGFGEGTYKVVNAEVRTSSQNILLGMAGMPCQTFTSNVKAGAFNEMR